MGKKSQFFKMLGSQSGLFSCNTLMMIATTAIKLGTVTPM